MKMRNFFQIAVFVLVFLLLNQVLGSLFLNSTRGSFYYYATLQDFENVQDQVSLVFLGDSHPQKAVMAANIPDAYNFSSSAESYILTYYKIRHYLESGDFHPQVAVVEIDMQSFISLSVEAIKTQDPAFWGQFVDYIDYGLASNSLVKQIPVAIKAHSPLVGGVNVVAYNLWPPEKPETLDLQTGFLPILTDFSSNSAARIREIADRRAQHHFVDFSYMNETMVLYFNRLLDLLEEYDVKVVLVWYPVTKQYYSRAAAYAQTDSHLETVQNLVSDRPIALILDYHKLFFQHLEYFSDSDHLNVTGAEIFTEILTEDLAEAGLLPASSAGE